MSERMDGFCEKLMTDAAKAAEIIRSSKTVLIITHIDADGITAGAIASMTLERLGKDYVVIFQKKITDETVNMVNNSKSDAVWICDLGSAYLSRFNRPDIIVTDHHVPDPKWKKKQASIFDFSVTHLNPHEYGLSGSYEVCGAGMTYILSKTLDPKNEDLAYLAVIGAVGDFQDNREAKLVSYNRIILKDAIESGNVIAEKDLRLFGREKRPIVQFIQYSNDPVLPGFTDNGPGCMKLYSDLDISLKNGNTNKVWDDLTSEEKERVTGKLMELVKDDEEACKRLYGEVYTLPNFEIHTGLRDAKEFATILNSCGRYDDAETGLRICIGDLSALEDAERNRSDHRRNISSALNYVKDNHLIRERKVIQYFDAGSEIRETVVGIVAGMLLNSGDVRSELPIIAFAEADDGVKVSARSNRILTDKGLDLSYVMKTAAEYVGGYGGGHNVAAGATIPVGKEEVFLDKVEELVSSQII